MRRNALSRHQGPHGFTRILRAFTLIELLVVIAIIALLVSILLPSLQEAKRLAKKAVCASNFHSVGVSVMFYASDYDGNLPVGAWEHRAIHDWTNLVGFGLLLEYYPDSPVFLGVGDPYSERGIFSCTEPPAGWDVVPNGGYVNWASMACLTWYQSALGGRPVKVDELNSGAAMGSGWIDGNPFSFGSIAGSFNHQRDGCNILYLDGSVSWRDSQDIADRANAMTGFGPGWSCRYVQAGFDRD